MSRMVVIRLFDDEAGETIAAPGTAYTEAAPLPNKRARVPFNKFNVLNSRVVVTAQGNEVGSGKGVEIWNQTGSAQLCQVTWSGNALQQALTAAWSNAHRPTADSELRIRVKGSSATENLTIYAVDLELEIA